MSQLCARIIAIAKFFFSSTVSVNQSINQTPTQDSLFKMWPPVCKKQLPQTPHTETVDL